MPYKFPRQFEILNKETQMLFIENISKDFPVGNAAGWCKSVDEVRKLAESAAQFVVVGSITAQFRGGNPGNTLAPLIL